MRWIRNYLFRIRIQVQLFRVPDPDPTYISKVYFEIIQKHPLNSIKKKNLNNYLPFSIQYYCPIVKIVQNADPQPCCAESDSAQCDTARSQVFREYLSENEFFYETILKCLSGIQMGSIHEEKKFAKNLVTLPL